MYATLFSRRLEIHALELMYRSLHPMPEKFGQFALRTFADKHPYNLMTSGHEHLLEGHRLGKMPPAFALNYKQKFHKHLPSLPYSSLYL